ncbi:aldo/keto reductase [Haloprofundus sp. MHR1]|uniref:aldo/keto reductase n=1 Tax=Haloprofundus sp. MHR1 TaxID=2572921 RepID=UPI0010BE4CA3|nr:aldo/keto reductase [Haloprofundus sp. MHR1]QCJ48483.1 aldo/keto reductase [Haloprofundus sp. MHR1]
MGLDGESGVESVRTAVEMGYRHLDTAQIYDNEAVVGRGLAESDVPREDVVVATKVWADKLGYHDALASTTESLERLQIDCADLVYVHRPIDAYDPERTLAAFDELVDSGRTRHVGVSNFSLSDLDEALDLLDAPLFAHQTELHPLFYDPELVSHAQEHDYYLVAYSPLAAGKVFDVPELSEIAEKHDADEAAVSIAWLAGKENVVTIPKASGEDHMRANLAAADLELDDEDVRKIESIEREEELFPE